MGSNNKEPKELFHASAHIQLRLCKESPPSYLDKRTGDGKGKKEIDNSKQDMEHDDKPDQPKSCAL